MSLMLDSIIFDLNPYFALVPLSFTSVFILYKFPMLLDRCVHFTVPSGRRGALFFLWEQMYTSGSTFIKD